MAERGTRAVLYPLVHRGTVTKHALVDKNCMYVFVENRVAILFFINTIYTQGRKPNEATGDSEIQNFVESSRTCFPNLTEHVSSGEVASSAKGNECTCTPIFEDILFTW